MQPPRTTTAQWTENLVNLNIVSSSLPIELHDGCELQMAAILSTIFKSLHNDGGLYSSTVMSRVRKQMQAQLN
jgi:hypothetical protein